MCLALGLRGHDLNKATDSETGLCAQHSEKGKKVGEPVAQQALAEPLPQKIPGDANLAPPGESDFREPPVGGLGVGGVPPPPPPSQAAALTKVSRAGEYIPVPPFKKRDGSPEWQDVAVRYKAATAGKGPMPRLREMSDAIAEMKQNMYAVEVADEFGVSGTGVPNWVSHHYGLQRLTEDVWTLIDAQEQRGKKISYQTIYSRLSRLPAADQLRLAEAMFSGS